MNYLLKIMRKVSIFYRLFFSFGFLISLSACFLTFFSHLKYSDQMYLNWEKQMQLLVQNISYKIEESMYSYEKLALSFYDNIELMDQISIAEEKNTKKEDREQVIRRVEDKLYQLKKEDKYLKNVQFISDNYQYVMRDEGGFQRGAIVKDIDAFYHSNFYSETKEKNGYPVWFEGKEQTELFYKSRQNIYGISDIVTMTISVYHPKDREFLGILIFNIDLEAFENSLSGLDYERNGNIFLVGSKAVLFGLNPSIDAPSFPKNFKIYEEVLKENKTIVRKNLAGRSVIWATVPVKTTDFTVAYIADKATLEEPLVKIRDLCLRILVITILISGMIAYLITISISIPIKELIESFKKLEIGMWSNRYKNTGKDEITILGNQYNEMAERMEELVKEVYLSEIKRQELQLHLKNSQLEALFMQINPHFLYNTLDIIRWEAMYESEGETAVTEMIEKFSRLCRMMIQTGAETIALKEVLNHASTYIDVINFRHKEKIDLKIHSHVDEEKVYVPRYIIQPIMENTVVHAFAEKREECRIDIHSFIVGETLQIEVDDNGQGIEKEQLEKIERNLMSKEKIEKSIGLRNIHQRIRLYYGEEYGLWITSDPGKGTKVTIKLKYKDKSEKMEQNYDISNIDC